MKAFTSQEKIDVNQTIASIQLALSIAEAIKNPEVLKTTIKELIEANTLAIERKAEVDNADKVIAEAKAATDAFESKKKEFNAYMDRLTNAHDDKIASFKAVNDDFIRAKYAHESEVAGHYTRVTEFAKEMERNKEVLTNREAALKVREERHINDCKVLDGKRAALAELEDKNRAETEVLNAKRQKMLAAVGED